LNCDYLHFWGKARPRDEAGSTWHPVAYHLLDVAASMEALLRVRPLLRQRAARLLGVPEEAASALLVAMAGLHDLGKFARPFQAKVRELWPACCGPLEMETIPARVHTQDGALGWDSLIRESLTSRLWPLPPEIDRSLMAAVFSHHGRPLRVDRADARWVFGAAGVEAATEATKAILGLLRSDLPTKVDLTPEAARRASWWISGVVSLADWIGSRQQWFPYRADLVARYGLPEYWALAREQAGTAVNAAGVEQAAVPTRRAFSALTGKATPTPLQAWATNVALPPGSVLLILEDCTGAGKTEAAQILVNRLLAEGRASGAYWGMPTQATANAMYDRQRTAIARLFDPGADPSIILAHSQAHRRTALQDRLGGPAAGEVGESLEDNQLSASASCSAFLADDRRAGLLADIGVGTIDQALLAILPSRFNTVRLAGLGEKVLVLDEIHAYDAYMQEEIAALLGFQAGLGGSAILLSATLPAAMRQRFIETWRDVSSGGRGHARGLWDEDEPGPAIQPAPFPAATLVAGASVEVTPVEAVPHARRQVPVRLVHEFEHALDHVLSAASQGAAVAWIRNTVDDCLRAAAAIGERGGAPLVFHARFAQVDREAREREVVARFGPAAPAAARQGTIVVATQVIEQSLDLDFDAMVSDLAPMDLLIQRAGRLWRHPARTSGRPPRLACELVILCPQPAPDPPVDWLGGEFRPTARVYPDPGVLWRTAQILSERGLIRTPDESRDLVERAYDRSELPAGLMHASDRALAERGADAAMARFSVLRLDDGYSGHVQAWTDESRVITRIGPAYTVLRLARVLPSGRLEPWAAPSRHGDPWALSEVRVGVWKVPPDARPDHPFEAEISAIRASWGRFEQEITVLPLTRRGDDFYEGRLSTPAGRTILVTYSRNDGFRCRRDAGLAEGDTSGGPQELRSHLNVARGSA
jgi:CRISPR-associated endonuclease/helicase Cas3